MSRSPADRVAVVPTASRRVTQGVRRSSAFRMMDLAWAIPDAIHLEIGEPDFSAPQHVIDAARRAVEEERCGYPPTAGLPELREAIAAKLARVNGIDTAAERVVVSNGGCQGLFNALSVVVDPGDAVALPDPGWPNYRSMVGLLGARIVTYALPAHTGHLPDPEELERLARSGVRAIVLCNPSNPLGTVAPPALVERVVDVARRHGVWLVSDECYDELYFGDEPPRSPAAVDPEAPIVSVFSFSKNHAMTGWRVGYVVCPPSIAEYVVSAQEPLVMGVNAPGQFGAIAALGRDGHVAEMRTAYRRRRDAVVDALVSRGHAPAVPDGAFYLWLDVGRAGIPDDEFVLSLLDEEHVALAAGSSFGAVGTGYVRVSLAAGQADLLEAVERIDRHVRRCEEGG